MLSIVTSPCASPCTEQQDGWRKDQRQHCGKSEGGCPAHMVPRQTPTVSCKCARPESSASTTRSQCCTCILGSTSRSDLPTSASVHWQSVNRTASAAAPKKQLVTHHAHRTKYWVIIVKWGSEDGVPCGGMRPMNIDRFSWQSLAIFLHWGPNVADDSTCRTMTYSLRSPHRPRYHLMVILPCAPLVRLSPNPSFCRSPAVMSSSKLSSL